MPPKKKAAAETAAKPSARAIGIQVAAAIRKSQAEWQAMVEAARKPKVERDAPPAYQGHDH